MCRSIGPSGDCRSTCGFVPIWGQWGTRIPLATNENPAESQSHRSPIGPMGLIYPETGPATLARPPPWQHTQQTAQDAAINQQKSPAGPQSWSTEPAGAHPGDQRVLVAHDFFIMEALP